MSITPLIKLDNVSKYYKTKTGVSEGMRKVSLEFYNNEFVGITGESGSGKTTLLNVISGLDSYEDGELYYNGLETSHYNIKDFEKFRAENIAFVFQDYNIIESYSVLDNVMIALIAQNYPKKEIKKRALELIEKVGLISHTHHKSSKLSGGQKQRVVIARALAKDAPIILADEPTGNLDSQSSKEVLDLLKDISKDKLVILVSHNLEEVRKYATRNIIMENGNIKNDIKLVDTNIKPSNIKEDFTKSNSVSKGFKIAYRNLLSTPKRTIFSLLLSSLVLFSFIYFYSTIYANFLNNILMSNDNNSELLVVKRDGTSYSVNDLNKFKITKESTYFFDFEYEELNLEFIEGTNERHYKISEGSLSSALREEELIAGRLPKSGNEIVIRKSRYGLDAEINLSDEVYIQNKIYKVVGINEYVNYTNTYKIYFYDEYIYKSINNNFKLTNEAEALIRNDYNFNNLVIRSKDRNASLIYKRNIDTDTYQIIDQDLRFENEMKAVIGFFKIFLWLVLLLILQVIFLIVYQILKNIMESRKKDFSVYRSVGINETEVSLMILFEQLLISLIASIILIFTFNLLANQSPFFYNIIRNLNFNTYFIIVVIFAYFSLRQGQKFNKKIFNQTVIEALKEDD